MTQSVFFLGSNCSSFVYAEFVTIKGKIKFRKKDQLNHNNVTTIYREYPYVKTNGSKSFFFVVV